jgi:hypothetical protein
MTKDFKNIKVLNRAAYPLLKLALFYGIIKLIFYLLGIILSVSWMKQVDIEIKATSDLSLNDLYYSIRNETQDFRPIQDDIIIINSGSLNPDNFRAELATLINQLSEYPIKAIGIDITFANHPEIPGTSDLISSIQNNPKIILGYDTSTFTRFLDFGDNITYGIVNFKEQIHTQRRYSSGPETFAAQLAKTMGYSLDMNDNPSDDFIVNYIQDTIYTFSILEKNCTWDTLFERTKPGFKELDLKDVFFSNSQCLQKLLKDKIILIGHLRQDCIENYYLDGEDKWAVPSHSNMLYRPLTMPGVMIHANAIQNIVNPHIRFQCWSDQSWFNFLEEILLLAYLAFLVFIRVGKFVNVIILLILSIPSLYFVLLAMKHNIYIEIGMTLLQFLIFEELVEIVEPLFEKIKVFFLSKDHLE